MFAVDRYSSSGCCEPLDIVPQSCGLRLRESLRPGVEDGARVAGGPALSEPLAEVPVEVHPVGVHNHTVSVLGAMTQDTIVTLGATVPPSVLHPVPVGGVSVLITVRIQNSN